MEYVQLKTDPLRIVRGPEVLPKSFRSISGFDRLSRKELASHGWFPWRTEAPPVVDERVERVITEVVLDADGVAYPAYTVRPCSPTERQHALAECRRERLSMLAAERYRRECAGVRFEGIPLGTDRASATALQLAALQGEGERWKALDGHWYALEAKQLSRAAKAVATYRRACFAQEEALAGALRSASDIERLDEIDLEQGWPSTSV